MQFFSSKVCGNGCISKMMQTRFRNVTLGGTRREHTEVRTKTEHQD